MEYTKTELAKLIETVETEFSGYLAKSEAANTAPLTKAEEKPEEKKEAKPESKEEGKAEAKPEHKEEGKEAAPKGEPKAEAKPEHKEEGKEAAPHAEGKEAAPAEHGYDDEDMNHMHTMYSSMSPAERKAHHDCIMKCASAEAAPAAPAAPSQGMEKSEKTEVKTDVINPETVLLKSELDAQKAANETLQKNLDGVKAFLTALVKKVPQGKAITSLDVVQKSEAQETKQLSKSEVTAILNKKTADPTLSKSDREAINQFCLNDANFNTISHLLK